MFRMTLIELGLAATPFVLFFAVRAIIRSRRRVVGEDLNDAPYQILLMIGATLAVGALVWQVLNRDEPANTGKIYIGPRVVDGELVPGHFVDKPADDDERFQYTPTADPLRAPDPPASSPRNTRTADQVRGAAADAAVDEADADDAAEPADDPDDAEDAPS